MTSTDGIVVGSCCELASGDAIEAFCNGTLVHRGPVTETAPEQGLFWILDTLTGNRRLLDMSELEIVRMPAPTLKPWYESLRPARRAGGEHSSTQTSEWSMPSPAHLAGGEHVTARPSRRPAASPAPSGRRPTVQHPA
jgi:hypothetical protein